MVGALQNENKNIHNPCMYIRYLLSAKIATLKALNNHVEKHLLKK